jgi:hypothetical protein
MDYIDLVFSYAEFCEQGFTIFKFKVGKERGEFIPI